MNKLNWMAMGLVLVISSGCGLRAGKGEDLHKSNATEVQVLKASLTYIRDEYGNCFAILNNSTDGFRSTFTMAGIDCSRLTPQAL